MKDICITYTYHRTLTYMEEDASIGHLNISVSDEVADYLLKEDDFRPLMGRQLTQCDTAVANMICWLADLSEQVIRMEDKILSIKPA